MLASKPKASLPEPSNHKEPANSSSGSNYSRAHASAPRVSRLAKPAATAGSSKQAAEARAPSPLHNAARAAAAAPLDKSVDAAQKPSPGERRSNFKASPHRTSTTPDRQPRVAKASELQAQLNLVQEDLRNAREHLANIDRDRAQVHGDLVLTKTLADEAYQKLEESLAAQRRAEEALELERFKSVEREQASMELARRKEEEWQRKHADITKRHAQDVNSLAKATKELENAMGELAVTAQAKNSALSRADEAEKTTQGIAKRMEILMAEVTRLKSEMESREKGAEEIIDKLRSEATELRAELQRAMAFQEKLVRAEEVVEGLKIDIAYAKRAEMDADQSAQGWKNKAAALNDRLVAITSLNKSNEEALASLTKSFQEAQSQLLQLTEKAAASECEASQYKEGFLETNRRLDIVRKEASDLQAAIDSLRSEHELLNEAHRQVVSNEKAASSQISILGGDKVRLQQELDEAREEKNKAKKGVEDVAAALRQVSAEAREAKERVLAKQTELDHAQLQISELKTTTKNAGDKHQLMLHESNCLKEKVEMLESEAKNAKENYELILDESNHLKKTVERLGSEAKILQDDRVSKEVRFAEMLRRSEEEASYVRSEMSKLMESLAAAETELQKLKAEKTQLVHQLEEGSERTAMDAPSSSAKQSMVAESSHLKDLLSIKEKEVLALDHQLTELRLREVAALVKADEASKLMDALRSSAERSMVAESSHLKDLLSTKEKEVLALGHQVTELRLREADALAKADEASKLMDAASSSAAQSMVAESSHLKDLLSTKEKEVLALGHQVTELQLKEAAALAKADEASRMMDAASSSAEQSMVAESSHLKDLLSTKEKEVLALGDQVTELRLREAAALAKADETSKLLAEATARKAGEEEEDRSADKSNALLVKLEMDTMLQSQRAAENEAKDAKDNMAQLQSKLRLVESKITEANLTAEEEKISSLRLKETLTEKEEELQSIVRENDSLRTREAAARAKADELAAMLAEATAMKGGDQSAGRSPEKQPNVFRKMMCSPMDNVARGDHEARRNSDRIVQVLEEIKHVEVETVRQVKHEREVSVEANSMENSKIIEDDLCKGMMSNGVDTESSDDDDIDSQGEDGAADQMGGLLTHGPRSSFKQEHHSHKKKKALLRKFGSMLKKKAHFTKLNKHS
ncbi:WEB family protein At3g02930, chloroplastic-like isoform X2 [Hordeum vulgare subsp. vulgare]|uniref:WEB family protein At3g02930, chloroplastic-like isoform X2 n=1 Tax=Hordeum vulgare subsp. vulgare TaxID=112509 RepID=UPI001D1A52C1|nr:WEB family protein At3g02930, chloroplastic-like isoform X2 [Hordeum vulgare subsp. vulgare]